MCGRSEVETLEHFLLECDKLEGEWWEFRSRRCCCLWWRMGDVSVSTDITFVKSGGDRSWWTDAVADAVPDAVADAVPWHFCC